MWHLFVLSYELMDFLRGPVIDIRFYKHMAMDFSIVLIYQLIYFSHGLLFPQYYSLSQEFLSSHDVHKGP